MSNKNNGVKKINFKKIPYRGIFVSIAKNEGVTPQAVRQAYWKWGNPRIIELVNNEVKRINQIIADNQNLKTISYV